MRRRAQEIVVRIAFVLVALNAAATSWAAGPAAVEFNRDVRPILSDTCFKCHGRDAEARQADLRFDLREEAVRPREGDEPATPPLTPIVPGDPSKSEAWRRIIAQDPEERMPPPESHLGLNDKQKETIRRWIEQGARYEPHWAFVPVKEPAAPKTARQGWTRNEIDAFV